VQWDPERSLRLEPLEQRAIQVGLSGEAVRRYVDEWIVSITDITGLVGEMRMLVGTGHMDEAQDRLPAERAYPLSQELLATAGAR
jgi:hypothetical protein